MSNNAQYQRRIQFIMVSDPKEASSTQTRKKLHAHAARETHAKVRRLRADKYHKSQATPIQGAVSFVARDTTKAVDNTTPLDFLVSHRADPFSSLVRAFTPREYFLLHYYVSCVVPLYPVKCRALFGDMQEPEHFIVGEWLRLALTDLGLLSSIFLSACRHLDLQQGPVQDVPEMLSFYKLTCLRELRQDISAQASSFSILTVAKAMAMGVDEMHSGDSMSLGNHMRGFCKMVDLNGGPQSLAINAFVNHFYHGFVNGKVVTGDGSIVLPQLENVLPGLSSGMDDARLS